MGQKFKTARTRKKVNLSQAAAATRVKVQHLEAMERDDFSKVPAPAYAKGFIRLYADYLGLDSVPLIREYVELHSKKEKSEKKELVTQPAPLIKIPSLPVKPVVEWLKRHVWQKMAGIPWKPKPILLALASVVVVFMLVAVIKNVKREKPAPQHVVEAPKPVETRVRPKSAMTALIQEPPEPYVDVVMPTPVKP